MAEKRSDTLFHDFYKSAEQFDYFMLGLVSAIVAYIVQNVTTGSLLSPSYVFQLLSVTSLLFAMFFGIIRLEKSMVCRRLNAKLLDSVEKRGAYTKAIGEGMREMLNASTGVVYTRLQLQNEIARITESLPEGEKMLEKTQKESLTYYKLRNRCFLFGVVGVYASKVAGPYIG